MTAPTEAGAGVGLWLADINGSSPVKILTADRSSIVGYAIYGPSASVNDEYPKGIPAAEANARVMAAAPDLLAALIECLNCEFAVTDKAAIAMAKAAIAKATGAQP